MDGWWLWGCHDSGCDLVVAHTVSESGEGGRLWSRASLESNGTRSTGYMWKGSIIPRAELANFSGGTLESCLGSSVLTGSYGGMIRWLGSMPSRDALEHHKQGLLAGL